MSHLVESEICPNSQSLEVVRWRRRHLLFLVPITKLDFFGNVLVPLQDFLVQLFHVFVAKLTSQDGAEVRNLTPNLGPQP